MKHLKQFSTLLLLALFCLLGSGAASATTYMYFKNLKPSGWGACWKTSGDGKAYAYFCNSGSDGGEWKEWTLFSGSDNAENAIYRVEVPTTSYNTVILTRGTSATFTSGSGFWNKTGYITIATDGKNYITSYSENITTATWDTYVAPTSGTVQDVLNGTHVMFYYGDTWQGGSDNSNQTAYLMIGWSKTQVTSGKKSTTQGAFGSTNFYYTTATATKDIKYGVSNNSGWEGVTMSDNVVAGNAYVLTNSNVNVLNVVSNTMSASFSSTSVEVNTGATSVDLGCSSSGASALSNATLSLKYYYTTTAIDGSNTWTEFDPSSISSLTASAGTYYVKALVGDGNVWVVSSNSCTLTVNAAVVAPTDPQISGTTSYKYGQTISLTASATGTTSGTTTYQWYRKAYSSDDYSSLGDASTTGATYSVATCDGSNEGYYKCVISNGTNASTSVEQYVVVAPELMWKSGYINWGTTSFGTPTLTNGKWVYTLTDQGFENSGQKMQFVIHTEKCPVSGKIREYKYLGYCNGDYQNCDWHNNGDNVSITCDANCSPAIKTVSGEKQNIEVSTATTGVTVTITYTDADHLTILLSKPCTTTPAFTMQGDATATTGVAKDIAVTGASNCSTYAWTVTSGNASNVTFGNASLASTTFTASAAGTYTLKMTATSDCGNTTEKTCTITVSDAATTYTYTLKIAKNGNTGWTVQAVTGPTTYSTDDTNSDWYIVKFTDQPTLTGIKFAYSGGGTWYNLESCSINSDVCYNFDGTVNESCTLCSAPSITGDLSTTEEKYTQGAAATALSVTATGDNLTYQWYSNTTNSSTGGTAISGATANTYTPSTSTAGTTYYYCVVSSGTCTTTSSVAMITVSAAASDAWSMYYSNNKVKVGDFVKNDDGSFTLTGFALSSTTRYNVYFMNNSDAYYVNNSGAEVNFTSQNWALTKASNSNNIASAMADGTYNFTITKDNGSWYVQAASAATSHTWKALGQGVEKGTFSYNSTTSQYELLNTEFTSSDMGAMCFTLDGSVRHAGNVQLADGNWHDMTSTAGNFGWTGDAAGNYNIYIKDNNGTWQVKATASSAEKVAGYFLYNDWKTNVGTTLEGNYEKVTVCGANMGTTYFAFTKNSATGWGSSNQFNTSNSSGDQAVSISTSSENPTTYTTSTSGTKAFYLSQVDANKDYTFWLNVTDQTIFVTEALTSSDATPASVYLMSNIQNTTKGWDNPGNYPLTKDGDNYTWTRRITAADMATCPSGETQQLRFRLKISDSNSKISYLYPAASTEEISSSKADLNAHVLTSDNYYYTGITTGDEYLMTATYSTTAKTWTVTMTKIIQSAITYSDGTGTTISNKTTSPAELGSTVSFDATLNTGYQNLVVSVKDADNNDVATTHDGNTYSFTMPAAAVTVSTSATEITYDVTIGVAEGASGKGSVSVESVSGIGIATASAEITAMATACYYFTGWTLPDGVTAATGYTSASNPIKINATATAQTITANFAERFALQGSQNDDQQGAMPGWSGESALFTKDANGNFVYKVTLLAGTRYKYKVYDRSSKKYCGATGDSDQPAGTEWTLKDDNSHGYAAFFTTTVAGDYTFTVRENTSESNYPAVTITYPASYKITYKSEEATYSTQYIVPATAITTFPTAPTKSGYTFLGWYTAEGTAVATTLVPTGDVELTAHFAKIEVASKVGDVAKTNVLKETVTIVPTPEGFAAATPTYTYSCTKGGAEVSITDNSFNATEAGDYVVTVSATENGVTVLGTCTVKCVIPGYFSYWKSGATATKGAVTESEGNKTYTIDGATASLDANTNYYFAFRTDDATDWTPATMFNWSGDADQQCEFGGAAVQSTYGASHAIYVTTDAFPANYNYTFSFDETNGQVSATRATTKYTVTYHANGQKTSTVPAAETVTVGAAVTLPAAMTRTDYVFSGWYDAEEGGTKVGDAGGTYTPTGNVDIYAHWTAKTAQNLSFGTPITTVTKDGSVTNTVTGAKTTVTYSSSSTSIATVTSAGVVTGKAYGTATITAIAAENDTYAADTVSYEITVENLTSDWYVKGTFYGSNWPHCVLTKRSGEGAYSVGYYKVNMSTADKDYEFVAGHVVDNKDTDFGTNSEGSWETYITSANCTDNNPLATGVSGKNAKFHTSIAGNYTFWVDYTNTTKPYVSMVYPGAATHTLAYGVNNADYGTLTCAVAQGTQLQEGEKIVLKATPASGYSIEGWYTDAACTKRINIAGTSTQFIPSISSTLNTFYVKFVADADLYDWVINGNFADATTWVYYAMEKNTDGTGRFALRVTDETKTYEFKLRRNNYSGEYGCKTGSENFTYTRSGNSCTLYADENNQNNLRFQPDRKGTYIFNATANYGTPTSVTVTVTYPSDNPTLTYDGDGNTGGTVPAASTPTYGSTVTVAADVSKAGYDFTGWLNDVDGQVYKAAGYTVDGTGTTPQSVGYSYKFEQAFNSDGTANVTCTFTATDKGEHSAGFVETPYYFDYRTNTAGEQLAKETSHTFSSLSVGDVVKVGAKWEYTGASTLTGAVSYTVREQSSLPGSFTIYEDTKLTAQWDRQGGQYYYRGNKSDGTTKKGWEEAVAMTNNAQETYCSIALESGEQFKFVDNTINYNGYSIEYINNHFLTNAVTLSHKEKGDNYNLTVSQACTGYVFYPGTTANPGSTPIFCAASGSTPEVPSQYIVLSVGSSDVLPNTTITLTTKKVGDFSAVDIQDYTYEYSTDGETTWTAIATKLADDNIIFTPRAEGTYVFRVTANMNNGTVLSAKGYLNVGVSDTRYYMKHPWASDGTGEEWVETAPSYDGSYYYVGYYHSGKNIYFNTAQTITGGSYVVHPTVLNGAADGDQCLFTLYPAKAYGKRDENQKGSGYDFTGAISNTITVSKLTSGSYPVYFGTTGAGDDYGTLTATTGQAASGTSITTGTSVADGTTVTFTAQPSAEYCVEGWYRDADCSEANRILMPNTRNYSLPICRATNIYVKFVSRQLIVRGSSKSSESTLEGMPGWTTTESLMTYNAANDCYEYTRSNLTASKDLKFQLYDTSTGTYFGMDGEETDRTMSATAGGWILNGTKDVYFTTADAGTYKIVAHINSDAYPEVGVIYPENQSLNNGYTSVKAGNYGTVCFPQAVYHNSEDKFYKTAYVVKNGNNLPSRLVLEEVNYLEPGVPYVVKFGSTSFTFGGYGTAAASAGSVNGLIGSFDGINSAHTPDVENELTGMFGIKGTYLMECGKGCWLAANRAYFDLKNGVQSEDAYNNSGSQSAPNRLVSFDFTISTPSAPTDLEDVNAQGQNDDLKFFKDGKLFIRHNGVLYDAAGRLIK